MRLVQRRPRVRIVASLGVLLMLSTLWRPTFASLDPAGSGAPGRVDRNGGEARKVGGLLRRLSPVLAEWERPEGDRSAAVLFDGDDGTSLLTGADAIIRVTMADAEPLEALGAYGGADGTLSVAAVDSSGRQVPVPGLQDIDLRGLPRRWNRFWATSAQATQTQELVLRWHPRSTTAELAELELWGLRGDDRVPAGLELADKLLGATPADAVESRGEPEALTVSALDVAEDGMASFKVRLDTDPRLLGRVFLVYELSGLSHFTAAARQVNGFSTQGGFHAELGAQGGLQVEEIAPEWLFRGDNEIRFLPADPSDPVGYRVRRLRIVGVPGVRPEAGGAAGAPLGDLARLSDRDPQTGLAAKAGPTFLTLPLAPGEQPAALTLGVGATMSGRLTAQIVSADGKPRGREVAITDLATGAHTVPLDGLPPGAGVRLAWNPGREGTGLLAEVRLATSPSPEGPARAIRLSYPLHGECVDHEAYLRGFVTPVGVGDHDSARAVQLLVDGRAVAGGLAADGAFGLVAAEPTRGAPWSVTLGVRYADGEQVSRKVAIEPCGDRPLVVREPDRGGPRPVLEDEGAPFGKVITAAKGGIIDTGDVLLQIPAGALERDTRITVRPLVDGQIASLENLMTNVTPEGRGFRLGPHNLQFKRPIRVTLPYKRNRVPAGLEDDLGIFFYDEPGGIWRQIPAAGSPDGHTLAAETTHFTDFIAATLAKPDHPTAASFNANTLTDFKVGNPMAGVHLIQAPAATFDGAAHLTYPIDVPPGRQGMQPHLSLDYSSDRGNGQMGLGWDVPVSKIEVDTRFGSPRYDSSVESERYILDGQELIPVLQAGEVAGSALPRLANRQFRFRNEGRFARITRVGNGWGATYWMVEDKVGTITFYGLLYDDPDVGVVDLGATASIAAWAITATIDLFGNEILYRVTNAQHRLYAETIPSQIIKWNHLEYTAIEYTLLNPEDPRQPSFDPSDYVLADGLNSFKVVFRRNLNAERPDVPSNARYGVEIREPYLLDGIDVYQVNSGSSSQLLRQYNFAYAPGEFGKSLLQSVAVVDGTSEFYRHTFKYKTIPHDAAGRPTFGAVQQWTPATSAQLPSSQTMSHSGGTSVFGSGFGAVGPLSCYPHVGVGYAASTGVDTGDQKMLDVNGDGLPDLISSGGSVQVNGFASVTDRDHGVFTGVTGGPATALEHSGTWSSTKSIGIHFPGELGGGGSSADSRVLQDIGFADMNGDGLPDYFTGATFAANTSLGGASKNVGFASAATWTGLESDHFPLDFSSVGQSSGTSFATAPLVRWTAPFTGWIALEGAASRTFNQDPRLPKQSDDVTASIYTTLWSGSDYITTKAWSWQFPYYDPSVCEPSVQPGITSQDCLNPPSQSIFFVTAGDQIYFHVVSSEGSNKNALSWNPHINYTSVIGASGSPIPQTLEPYGPNLYSFDFQADHRLVGLPAPGFTTASADTRPNGTTILNPTTVTLTGQVRMLAPAADDVFFQAVRLRPGAAPVVVWPANGLPAHIAAGDGASSIDMGTVSVNVQGRWVQAPDQQGVQRWAVSGDQILFQVISDTPVDPHVISWQPIVTYQNFCKPDPVWQSAQIQANPGVVPDPTVAPVVCVPAATALSGNQAQVIQPQFPEFRAVAGPTNEVSDPTPFQAPNGAGTLSVAANLSGTITAGPNFVNDHKGRVTFVVQAPGQANPLIYKSTVNVTGGTQSFAFNTPSFQTTYPSNVHVSAYVYGQHTVQLQALMIEAGFNGRIFSSPSRVVHIVNPPLAGSGASLSPIGSPPSGNVPDGMSGGYHQWSFGFANGADGFDPSLIRYDPSTSSNADSKPFFAGREAPNGLSNTADPNYPGRNGPLWSGPGGGDYIAPGFMHPSFFGSGGDPPLPNTAVFRRTVTHNTDLSGNAYVTVDVGFGNTIGEVDIMDMNGDGLPDLVGNGTIGYNAFLQGRRTFDYFNVETPLGYPRTISQNTASFGLGLGSLASVLVNQTSAGSTAKGIASSLPSFGLGDSSSATQSDLIDINGDGLPDQVNMDGSGNLTVFLNRGYGFQQTDPGAGWSQPPGLSSSSSANIGTRFLNTTDTDQQKHLASLDQVNVLRLQESVRNSLQVNIFGIGGGPNFTAARTIVDMADMNGDGLPDRVMKQPGTGTIVIEFNLGDGFGPPETWTMPGWGSVDIENGNILGLGLGSNDALSFNQTVTIAGSGGFPLFFPIPNPFLPICLVFEFSIGGDVSRSNTQMVLEDINGDGLPDEVFKKNDLTELGSNDQQQLWVKLNPAGGANLLRRVENSFGGSFDLEYARAGNEVDRSNGIDVPTNHWVMSAVTTHSQPTVDPVTGTGTAVTWNSDPDDRTEFAYSKGFYSRRDKEFLGFADVVTTRKGDNSTVEEQFSTKDVYWKGLLTKRIDRDGPVGTGHVFDVEQIDRPDPVVLAPGIDSDRPVQFFAEETQTFRHYDGGGTNPDATTGVVTRQEYRKFETTYGYLSRFEDRGDTSSSSDDVTYTVDDFFTSGDPTIYLAKPRHVAAVDSAAKLIKQRRVTYLSHGETQTVSDTQIGGLNPSTGAAYTGTTAVTWTFGYDKFGNMNSYTEPKAASEPIAYNVQVTAFDSLAHTYPLTMSDSFGYTWSQQNDLMTGAITQQTDINGTTLLRQPDQHFRLMDVIDTGAGIAMQVANYLPMGAVAGQPAQVSLHNSTPGYPDIVTKTLVDGWGRPMQVIKPGQVDTGTGTAQTGLVFSGRLAYDGRSRLVTQGQETFVATATGVEAQTLNLTAAVRPMTFHYDILSRKTETDFPDGNKQTTTYSVSTALGAVARHLELFSDALTKVRKTYRDARGRVAGVTERNTIAGVAKDLTTTYGYDPFDRVTKITDAKSNVTTGTWDSLGNLVSIANPDTGTVQWLYDPQGRLAAKQTPNLGSSARTKYVYEQNRLKTIDYPTSTDVQFTYGPPGVTAARTAGRVTQRTDESGTESYEYGPLGEIVKRVRIPVPNSGRMAVTFTTLYNYDETYGRLKTITFPDAEVVTYTYDAAGQVIKLAGAKNSVATATYVSNVTYDDQGARRTIALGNGVKTTYTYDVVMRRLKNIDTKTAAGTVIQAVAYSVYDAVGNITSLQNNAPAAGPTGTVSTGPTTQSFTYDDLYQLTVASGRYTLPGTGGHRDYTLNLAYDEIGNTKSKTQTDKLTPSGGTAQTQAKTSYPWTYTYNTTGRPHLPSAVGPQTLTYDADGNQKSSAGTSTADNRTSTWNEDDRLKQVVSGSTTSNFLYGNDGERSHKRVGVNEVVYVNPGYVVKTGVQATKHITIGDERIASVVTPTSGSVVTFYYHTDQLHSSGYVTDASSPPRILQHDEYLPSGEVWVEEILNNDTTHNRTPYLFTAKELDESNLYYFGARYYEPRTGLWQSADPEMPKYMRGGGNTGGVFAPRNLELYSYAFNNPVGMKDPDGKDVIIVVGANRKGKHFDAVANQLARDLVGGGIPKDQIQMVRLTKGEKVSDAVKAIQQKGRKVSAGVWVGHGGPGNVAADPRRLSVATVLLSDFANDTHVANGGAVVAASCRTVQPGGAMDRAELTRRDISVAGYRSEIGFATNGNLQVPYQEGKVGNQMSPGASVPEYSNGPESNKTLTKIVVGAEKRVNPTAPPPKIQK